VSTIHRLAVGALTAAAYLHLHQQLLMLLLQSQAGGGLLAASDCICSWELPYKPDGKRELALPAATSFQYCAR